MCMARHGMLSERVGSMHVRKHYVCASLVQNAVCRCCALCTSVKKGFCKVTGEKTNVCESQGWQHQQGSSSMKRFAGISLILASQFVAWVSQLFTFPLSAYQVLQLSPLCTALFTTTCAQERQPGMALYGVPLWARALVNKRYFRLLRGLLQPCSQAAPSFPSLAVWKSHREPVVIYHVSDVEGPEKMEKT